MKIKVEPGLAIVDCRSLTTVIGNCMQNSEQDVKAIISCTYKEEEQNTFSLIKKENSGSDLVVVSKQEPELTILDEHANITDITPKNRTIATNTCPIVVRLKHEVFSVLLLTLLVSQVLRDCIEIASSASLSPPVHQEAIVTQNGTNKIREFECYVYNLTFANKVALTTHVRTHAFDTKELKFQCYQCRNYFSNETDCRRHIMSATCCQLFVCRICDKIFQSCPKLQRHLSHHISGYAGSSTPKAKNVTSKPEIKFAVVVKSSTYVSNVF